MPEPAPAACRTEARQFGGPHRVRRLWSPAPVTLGGDGRRGGRMADRYRSGNGRTARPGAAYGERVSRTAAAAGALVRRTRNTSTRGKDLPNDAGNAGAPSPQRRERGYALRHARRDQGA